MAKLGPFPYIPPMEDCRRIVKTEGCTCFIMDTCCRDMTPEDKAAIDRQIVRIAMDAALRKQQAAGSA